MSKEKPFPLIKQDILRIAEAIPVGEVTTFKAIGDYMSIMSRHVAYILATLSPEEQDRVPWHRVVGKNGALGKEKISHNGDSQADLLAQEGVILKNKRVADFGERFTSVETLGTDVVPHQTYKK